MRSRPKAILLVLVLAAALAAPADAKRRPPPLCATVSSKARGPVLVILSAFPAELVPLVAATAVEKTIEVGGRSFYVGRMEGVRVVIGLMGIGLVNADNTAEAVIDGLHPAGVIVSGVAGSNQRIGDVVISDDWMQQGLPAVQATNVAMIALARRAAPSVPVLEHCATVPPTSPTGMLVCFPFTPVLVFGGHGISSDPYGGVATKCAPGGGDVLGCELPKPAALVAATADPLPEIQDQETAAVARRALEHGVPFLGVRAVSDGAGDVVPPRPPFSQFFDYYVLAARNAGAVTRTVVAELARVAKARSERPTCRLLARRRWDKAAGRLAP